MRAIGQSVEPHSDPWHLAVLSELIQGTPTSLVLLLFVTAPVIFMYINMSLMTIVIIHVSVEKHNHSAIQKISLGIHFACLHRDRR